MQRRRTLPGWLGLFALLLSTAFATAQTQVVPAAEKPDRSSLFPWRAKSRPAPSKAAGLASRLEIDVLPEDQKAKALAVLEKPVLHASGPLEAFYCQPDIYQFLLDHPDKAAKMWRKFGAQCADIEERGEGRFAWKDETGQLNWQTVVRTSRLRVWYAEGWGKPAPLLPSVAVKALLVMHLQEGHDQAGKPAVRHQCELILQTDSKAFALVARLLGGSVPRMAEQYLGQVETFFAGLASKLDEYPERVPELMAIP